MPNQDIELRSEEVQEILSRVPHWMIRWGNVLILLLVVLLLVMSWFIKYPEVVKTDIVITTSTPPEKLIARSSGRFEKILIKNRQQIKKGMPLAVIENTADYKDVFRLKYVMDTLSTDKSRFTFPFEQLSGMKLGDIGLEYASFERDFLAYQFNSELNPHAIEGTSHQNEILLLEQRLAVAHQQRTLGEDELVLRKRELQRYRKLYGKGVISTQEWDTKNIDYLQFEKELKNLISSISHIKSSLNELTKISKTEEINEIKDQVNLHKNIIQSFYRLKDAIAQWELKYVLRASITGEITFLQYWKENQNITEGDNIFNIIPVDNDYYLGKVTAPSQNSGKLKIGQKVNIRLANYPDHEFGIIQGKVEYISLTPDKEGRFLIDVMLPDKLKTSYNKSIDFRQEMSGTADIVTEDLRLIERLFYQLRGTFNKN